MSRCFQCLSEMVESRGEQPLLVCPHCDLGMCRKPAECELCDVMFKPAPGKDGCGPGSKLAT